MTQRSLGPLEQKVMSIVWSSPGLTVNGALRILNTDAKKELAYTTVMTVLKRLYQKNLISRKKQHRSYAYFAKSSQHSFVQKLVKSTMRSLIERFGEEALAAFMTEARSLSKKKQKSE